MNYYTALGIGFMVCLFFLILLFLYLGNKYRIRQELIHTNKKISGIQPIQGVIFALLGLLLAFTFTGAINKFDQRRTLIIDEANAISTLSLRLDLLPLNSQSRVKQELRNYASLRIKTYQAFPNVDTARVYLSQSLAAQNQLWKDSLTGCTQSQSSYACMLIVPSLNSVFDIANTRTTLTQMHPPFIIFILLIIATLASAFFVGFEVSESNRISSIHIFIFSLIMTIIIFSIIDMEYPRLGFIRVDAFDNALVESQKNI